MLATIGQSHNSSVLALHIALHRVETFQYSRYLLVIMGNSWRLFVSDQITPWIIWIEHIPSYVKVLRRSEWICAFICYRMLWISWVRCTWPQEKENTYAWALRTSKLGIVDRLATAVCLWEMIWDLCEHKGKIYTYAEGLRTRRALPKIVGTIRVMCSKGLWIYT